MKMFYQVLGTKYVKNGRKEFTFEIPSFLSILNP